MSKENIKEMDVHSHISGRASTHLSGTVYCDSFIIPNPAETIKEMSRSSAHALVDFALMNNLHIDLFDDKCVQLWHVTKDCDNLVDHNFCYVDPDSGMTFSFSPAIEYLPVSMFQGKKEGDTVEFDYNDSYTDKRTDLPVFIQLHFVLRLSQLDYRYRDYGRFEYALEKVAGY
jgi:hypothetical protein